jgi:hypothetical protein
MSVKITLKNYGDATVSTPEQQSAQQLADIFRSEFENFNKSASGEILILSNLTLIGQEVKDIDLLIVGYLENFKLSLNSKSKDNKGVIQSTQNIEVEVKTFCYVIELKDHPIDRIKTEGGNSLVEYRGHWHDATNQSEKQKFSLLNYFNDNLGVSPYICNFIWFRNITNSEYITLYNDRETNVFSSEFTFRNLIQKSTFQSIPYKPEKANYSTINNISNQNRELLDKSKVLDVFDLFEQTKKACGTLTRQKVELLTKAILEEQKEIPSIGEKLTVLAGRAGTGKTVRLLQVATNFAKSYSNRCLILTFNHALVSDIRRVLAFAGMPDGIDNYTVQISTLHAYFIKILNGFGIIQGGIDNNSFETIFNEKTKELVEYLNQDILNNADVQALIKNEYDVLAWDYILIDEAQDWSENEKDILFAIYGREKIIVADGVDQFIRSGKKQDWARGLKQNTDFYKKTETTGLRQKFNLVNFVNHYSEKAGLSWKVTPNNRFVGGKIIITTNTYSTLFHKRLFDDCISNGNAAYDMLFLVPPQLIEETKAGKTFSKIDIFKNNGILLFDGTNANFRNKYPINLNECRLFQYDSCRGLEGWTVVCLQFDELINYKLNTWEEPIEDSIALESLEDRKRRYVNLWSLMPLTRAIDTLVITIKNKESMTAKMLKELSNDYSDTIEWID